MTVSALDQKTVQLMANQMIMKSKTTLTQYEMTKWTLEKTERGISMIIVFKRMVTSELLTTYMPSLLLIFTTYATTFFKPFYFEAAVTVNLTTMLVMTTIFTNLMDKLPPTAYVKMIDIWLIGGQLIPFIEVVLLTIIEMLRDGNGSGVQTINHHGQPRVLKVFTERLRKEREERNPKMQVEPATRSPTPKQGFLVNGKDGETRAASAMSWTKVTWF